MTDSVGVAETIATIATIATYPVADPAETALVTFQVLGVDRVDRGRLIGLAIVEVEIGGVGMTLQGVQVVRGDDGRIVCGAPVFRHPRTGQWLPAVLLPNELRDALAREVLASFRGVSQ